MHSKVWNWIWVYIECAFECLERGVQSKESVTSWHLQGLERGSIERDVPPRVWIRSLNGLERGIPSRIWNEAFPLWSGTRCTLKGLDRGVLTRIWDEASPQGSGTRFALKGLKQGIPQGWGLEQVVPSRVSNKVCLQEFRMRRTSMVWNELFPQGSGTRCALKGLERDFPLRVWNEMYSQGSGARRSRVWNEVFPQGSGVL